MAKGKLVLGLLAVGAGIFALTKTASASESPKRIPFPSGGGGGNPLPNDEPGTIPAVASPVATATDGPFKKMAPAVLPASQAAKAAVSAAANRGIAAANASLANARAAGAAIATANGTELEAHLKANPPGTESPAVVGAFQEANKLYVDKRYGPGTALALGRKLGRRPPDPRVWPVNSNPTQQMQQYKAKLAAAGLS